MGHLRIVTATGKADLPYARMVNGILVFFTKESLNAVPSCNRGASLDTVHSSHSEVLATKTAFFFTSYYVLIFFYHHLGWGFYNRAHAMLPII